MQADSPSPNVASLSSAVVSVAVTVSPEMPIEDAIACMSKAPASCVLITQQQRPIGIFTERDLVRLIASTQSTIGEPISTVMTPAVKTLRAAEIQDAFSLSQYMQQYRLRHLPVVDDDGQLVGIVTKESLRKSMTPSTLLKLKRVEEVMTTQVVCASLTVGVRQIAQKIDSNRVSCVVIVDAETRPVGIITERDIVQFQALALDLDQTQAQTVMSTPLLPIHPQDSLWDTHQQMNQRRVRRFVVCTADGELAGLITQSSLLQALNPAEVLQMIELLQHEVEQLRTENQAFLEARNRELEVERTEVVTALKQSYSLLDQSHKALESRVASRTAELHRAEHRWRMLLENVQLVVIGLDSSGKVTYANPFFLKLTGYAADEVIDADWFSLFIPPSEHPAMTDYFRQLQGQLEVPLQYQNTILSKSGEERIIVWNNTVLRDLQDNIVGTMSIGEDITQRFAIDRMKGEFVAMVNHELRTPLTAIHGGIKLLSQGIVLSQSEAGKNLLQVVAKSSQRLVRLVDEILELERLESGKHPLRKQPLNTQVVTRHISDAFQMIANQANVAIEVSDPGIQILADRDRLQQVLTNLLDNAIKFSPPNSTIRLSVEAYRSHSTSDASGSADSISTRENNNVLFTLCDQGKGILPEQYASIFERFVQKDKIGISEKGGTGLGLAICRNIVEQHGGKIWVESTLGAGSCFFFTLPINQPD